MLRQLAVRRLNAMTPRRDHHIWTLGRTTTGIENSTVVLRCQHAMPQRLHLFDSLLLPKFTPMNVLNAGVDTPTALKLTDQLIAVVLSVNIG